MHPNITSSYDSLNDLSKNAIDTLDNFNDYVRLCAKNRDLIVKKVKTNQLKDFVEYLSFVTNDLTYYYKRFDKLKNSHKKWKPTDDYRLQCKLMNMGTNYANLYEEMISVIIPFIDEINRILQDNDLILTPPKLKPFN